MRRREFITLLGGAAAWPLTARAQQPPNLLRVGTVSFIRRTNFTWAAFEQRMRELGYIEGQNLAVEFINAKDHVERIEEAARDLSRRKVDIGLADSHLTLKSIMAAMSTSPIVFVASNFDPVALGFVASIARPGGNLTGIYVRRPELVEKQIGMLAEAFPGKTRLAVLWDGLVAESFPAAERAAAALHLELQALKLENPPYDFVVAFHELARRGAQMVLVLHSPLFTEDRSHIAALALRHGLPTMFASKAGCRWPAVLRAGPQRGVSTRGRLC